MVEGPSLTTNTLSVMATGMGRGLMSAKKKKRKGIHINPAHKGELHSALGVPQGQNIPAGKIAAAAKSGSADLRRKAQFALNAKRFKH